MGIQFLERWESWRNKFSRRKLKKTYKDSTDKSTTESGTNLIKLNQLAEGAIKLKNNFQHFIQPLL